MARPKKDVSEAERKQRAEAAHAKFRELASLRTNKALRAVRLVRNLAGRPHTKEEAARIVSALRSEIDGCESALNAGKAPERSEFTL